MKASWAIAAMLQDGGTLLHQYAEVGTDPPEIRPLDGVRLDLDEVMTHFDRLVDAGALELVSTQSMLICPRCHGTAFEVIDSSWPGEIPAKGSAAPRFGSSGGAAVRAMEAVPAPRPLATFACPHCGVAQIAPGYLVRCQSCQVSYDASIVGRTTRRAYRIEPAGLAAFLAPLDRIRQTLDVEGFDVSSPGQVVGTSGVAHLFDFVIHGGARPIVVTLEEADTGVNELAVLAHYARLRDLPDVDGLLVAIPGLGKSATALAQGYAIDPIEVPDCDALAAALVERLRTVRQATSQSTGVPGLDLLLGGGFPGPHPYLVVGSPQSGKSLLCAEFAAQGARLGHPTLYIVTQGSPEALVRTTDSLGLTFRGWIENGMITFLNVGPQIEELSREAATDAGHLSAYVARIVGEIGYHVRRLRAGRLVIDSVGPLLPSNSRAGGAELLSTLDSLGCLTLMTLPDRESAAETLSSLVRGTIRLRRDTGGGSDRVWLTVPRMTGRTVDPSPRECRVVAGQGLIVGIPSDGPRAPAPATPSPPPGAPAPGIRWADSGGRLEAPAGRLRAEWPPSGV